MSGPTVSAVVTAYDAAPFVGETLTAILAQARPPDEVIVVDDGSTDGTAEILAGFGDAIRVVRQANAGHAGALNHAIRLARGEYVAKCDADDVWLPHKLARQTAALRADPGIGVTFAAARFCGSAAGPYSALLPAGRLDPAWLARSLFRGNFICASSTVMRRSLFDALGPFREDFPAEDYEFWFRALRAGVPFHADPEVLVRYRRHDAQVTSRQLDVRRAAHEVHRRHAAELPDRTLVRSVLARDLSGLGRLTVDHGRPRDARALFAASLRERPTAFAAAWLALLSVPARARRPLVGAALSLRRRVRAAAP